jgi:hypothetical protein
MTNILNNDKIKSKSILYSDTIDFDEYIKLENEKK